MEDYGQVDSLRPRYAAKPGVGLATCGLSLTVLSMLGYAVATSRAPHTRPESPAPVRAIETAEVETRDAGLDSLPSVTHEPEVTTIEVGQLEAWAPDSDDAAPSYSATIPLLDEPVYEAPYGSHREVVVELPPTFDPEPIALDSHPEEAANDASDAQLPPLDEQEPESELVAADSSDKQERMVIETPDGEALAETLAVSSPVIENPYINDQPPAAELEVEEDIELAETPAAVASVPVAGPPPAEGMSLFGPPPASEGLALLPTTELPAPAEEVDTEEDFLVFEDAEAQLASEAPLDDLLVDTPAPVEMARLLTTDVQEAFALGRHGALHAARARFIAVMRKVALARDAQLASDAHATALAAGLRALEEADDFVPRGGALDTDLDVQTLAASHSTPLYRGDDTEAADPRWTPPHEAIARYHRYAQHKLARAVGPNQAGSMALHGLGKTYARLAEIEDKPLAERTSLTMYRAAVESHPGNYLAANELGVGLAKAGRYQAARKALEQAVAGGAKSTVYRNLAVVQEKLGQNQLAMAARVRADQLASAEMAVGAFSRERGVQWVRPKEFARVAEASGPADGRRVAGHQPLAPAQHVGQRPAVWGRPMQGTQTPRVEQNRRGPIQNGHIARNQIPRNRTAQPVRSQTIVR